MSHILITSFLISLAITALSPHVFAEQESYELMCRNKAKEIAAETYKNCVTELRQNQIGKIRDEYKQKLSELKSHYDSELKKLSNGQAVSASNKPLAQNSKSKKSATRASGARSLPEKKVRTEIVDLQSPADTQTEMTAPVVVGTEISESRVTSEQEGLSDSEVVELPVQ